jgi:hypothetical protein
MTRKEKTTTLDSRVYKQWKIQMQNMGFEGNTSGGEVKNMVITVKSAQMFNRRYVASKDLFENTPGNSNVEIDQGGDRIFGRISLLFSDSTREDVWFVIRPFVTLNRWDQEKNPYKGLPQLNVKLLYARKLEKAVVVHQSKVVGHIAILGNKAGTFGINQGTISAVSLGSVVSIFDIIINPTSAA